MATPEEAVGIFGASSPGEPQLLTVICQGLQYRGEVVLADDWRPAWGQPLESDVYFRIVLLRHRRPVPPADIEDSRIAACIPARGPSRARGKAGKELTTLRETQAHYLTRRDPETVFVRSYLERQREQLEGQLVRDQAASYADGRIESPSNFGEDIDWFFAGPEPAAWLERIASLLLSWAYPALPLETSLIPRPLTPEDVPRLFDAIFASSPESGPLLGDFGPALGLSKSSDSLTFDPAECRAFQHIRAELESRQEEAPWQHMQAFLAHATGLTRPLATLYLLTFVYYGQPEIELGLDHGHGLSFRDGRPVRGTRLTRELMPLVAWRDDLFAQQIVTLRLPSKEISWNDALQYTSLLCQGLTEAEAGPEIARQERELIGALDDLARDVGQAGEIFRTLALAPQVPNPDEEQPRSTLQRLSEVCEGEDFQTVYKLALRGFGDPRRLLQELELLKRLLHLGESLEEIIRLKSYVDGAEIETGYDELSFDRTAVLKEMSLQVFLGSPRGWPTVRAHVREFRSRYSQAYVAAHDDYQREDSRLRASLEDSRLKLNALGLLNSIAELGEPVGTELAPRHGDLERRIRSCDVDSRNIPLHLSPRCSCRMALGQAPPSSEVGLFHRDLERPLEEQNRRLSLALMERILHGRTDQRLEDFLRIVQASDLSALSNTLNDELAQFIQQLLRSP